MRLGLAMVIAACAPSRPADHVTFGAPRWIMALPGTDGAATAAFDPAGDVIVGGSFHGTVDFGNDPLTAADAASSWLSKRSGADGSNLWTIALDAGPALATSVRHLAVDADGSIVATGSFGLARFDPDGHELWSMQEFGDAIGVDQSDNIYLNSYADVLTSYDPAGVTRWSLTLPRTQGYRLAMTSDDRVALATELDSPAMFGDIRVNAQNPSLAVAVVTDAGEVSWATTLAGGGGSVGCDLGGRVFASHFDAPDTLTAFDADGTIAWRRGSTTGDSMRAITARWDGRIVTVGQTQLEAYTPDGRGLDTLPLGDVIPDGGYMFTLEAAPDGALLVAGTQLDGANTAVVGVIGAP